MTEEATPPVFAHWRAKARRLLAAEVSPEAATWAIDANGELFEAPRESENDASRRRIPTRLVDLFRYAACHRDLRTHALMYRALWRTLHGEPRLVEDAADDDVVSLTRQAKAVSRSRHKMTAFVRFREVVVDGGSQFMSWFVPEHDVLYLAAPFFARRFGTMRWTIATPDGIAHWDRKSLSFEGPDPSVTPPAEDAAEALWLTYYESIFNPARLNVKAMRMHMPQRYWRDLPEAQRIPALVVSASERAGRMAETTLERDVAPFAGMQCGNASRPKDATRDALDTCRRCELGRSATQAVPGEGPRDARIVVVGEQPGDEEDLAGRPFVGPAGRVLDDALREAGIARSDVYFTNAVKHFRFEPRGKRRIHKTPAQRHVEACRTWLESELAALCPAVVVTLGATALLAVSGRRQSIAEARRDPNAEHAGARLVASYHPSAVLRAVDAGSAEALRRALVDDLRLAAELARARTDVTATVDYSHCGRVTHDPDSAHRATESAPWSERLPSLS